MHLEDTVTRMLVLAAEHDDSVCQQPVLESAATVMALGS